MQYYITPMLWVDDEAEAPKVQDAIDLMHLGVRVYVPTAALAKDILLALGVPKDHVDQQVHYCMTGEWVQSSA